MKQSLSSNCPHCEGTGKLKLDGPLAECAAILKVYGPLSAKNIHEKTRGKLDITATHKRLKRLIERGAVKVEGAVYRLVG